MVILKNILKIAKHYKVKKHKFKNANNLDKLNLFHSEIAVFLCLTFSIIYHYHMFATVRNALSDTIALSSIILGIIGVLIGILIGLSEDSDFFKKAAKYGKSTFYYNSLMGKMKVAFLTNIIFVSMTVFFNFILPSSLDLLKIPAIFIWSFLFMKILWQVTYLILVIISIATYEESPSNNEKKRS